jgi:hypothetical protein
MIRVRSLALACLLVAGCVPRGPAASSDAHDGGAPHAEQRPPREREHLERLAPLPESPLAGEDADHDHIRDDIERYIDDTYRDREALWLAARQYARAEQHGLVFAKDAGRAQDAGNEIARAIECLYVFLPADEADAVWKELRGRTLDEDDRVDAWLALQDALAGGYYESSANPKDACAFDSAGLQP